MGLINGIGRRAGVETFLATLVVKAFFKPGISLDGVPLCGVITDNRGCLPNDEAISSRGDETETGRIDG